MAQGRKGKLNYRCPRCLMREIDMDMLYDQGCRRILLSALLIHRQ